MGVVSVRACRSSPRRALPARLRQEDDVTGFSVNERAERLMGRRLTPAQEKTGVVAFDMPCELGYQCPVCQAEMDEKLQWSEYRGFLWCAECNRDYPSALCVPMVGEKRAEWVNVGPDDAVNVYLDTMEQAVTRALLLERYGTLLDALELFAAVADDPEIVRYEGVLAYRATRNDEIERLCGSRQSEPVG